MSGPFRCSRRSLSPNWSFSRRPLPICISVPANSPFLRGAKRALYAVLSGKIEVVKMFDGIERTLGWRVPGTIFGEVPIAFGTVFVGGYRASEPSRVFRVDPKHYYAIAATSPEVVAKIGALARERIGGLAGHCSGAAQGACGDGRTPLGCRMQ